MPEPSTLRPDPSFWRFSSRAALPFGLAVLILQRTPERNIQDQLTLVGGRKKLAATIAFVLAILVLVPIAPELSSQIGITPPGGGNFL